MAQVFIGQLRVIQLMKDFQEDYEKLLHRRQKNPLFNIIPSQFGPENITIYYCTILVNITFSLMNHTTKWYPSTSLSYYMHFLPTRVTCWPHRIPYLVIQTEPNAECTIYVTPYFTVFSDSLQCTQNYAEFCMGMKVDLPSHL